MGGDVLTERQVQDIAVAITALNAGRIDGQQAVASIVAQVERVVAERVRAAYAEAVQASNDLHLLHPNTTGCWGGIGGSAVTPECAIDCPNPKHEKAQIAWRDICRQAQGERAYSPGQPTPTPDARGGAL